MTAADRSLLSPAAILAASLPSWQQSSTVMVLPLFRGQPGRFVGSSSTRPLDVMCRTQPSTEFFLSLGIPFLVVVVTDTSRVKVSAYVLRITCYHFCPRSPAWAAVRKANIERSLLV
jgi:hypothetical protein